MKESLLYVDHPVKGFPLVVYTDHKANLFTSSLRANKRMQDTLLRWSLEAEDMSNHVQRVWVKGSEHILGGAPSRNPEDRD